MPRVLALMLALVLSPAAVAQSRIDPVYDLLGMPQLMEIMRQEGLAYGEDLEADLFPGRGGEAWRSTVAAIYALPRMEAEIRAGLEAELDAPDLAEIVAFFDGETGARIVALEIAARRAMLDDAIEEAAHEDWMALRAEDGPRWQMLSDFAEINDLIESNVAGAMTSNYAFYMGLIDGDAFDFDMPEDQVLADVWSQEQAIRDETLDWVFSFTALAYQPLSDEEFRDYLAFSATEEGQALNAALFNAFNTMFTGISRDLGLGAARFLAGRDI